jgi:hypothetical protein
VAGIIVVGLLIQAWLYVLLPRVHIPLVMALAGHMKGLFRPALVLLPVEAGHAGSWRSQHDAVGAAAAVPAGSALLLDLGLCVILQ